MSFEPRFNHSPVCNHSSARGSSPAFNHPVGEFIWVVLEHNRKEFLRVSNQEEITLQMMKKRHDGLVYFIQSKKILVGSGCSKAEHNTFIANRTSERFSLHCEIRRAYQRTQREEMISLMNYIHDPPAISSSTSTTTPSYY